MFPRRCLYKMCRGTHVSKNQKRQINRSYNVEELEQQPRIELTVLWELREFRILYKRSTAAALLVAWLSQKTHKINHRTERLQNIRGQRTGISLPGKTANRDGLSVSQKIWSSIPTGYIISFLVIYPFLLLLEMLFPFFQMGQKNIVTIQVISRRPTRQVVRVQKMEAQFLHSNQWKCCIPS